MKNQTLSIGQVSRVLGITEWTLRALVRKKDIPFHLLKPKDSGKAALVFYSLELKEWLRKTVKNQAAKNELSLEKIREIFLAQHAASMRALKCIDRRYSAPRQYKGYSLVKIPSKKHGFLFYVRYIQDGKLIPSKWNTHTNDKAKAEIFAKENRGSILESYHMRRDFSGIFTILESYYKKESPYLTMEQGCYRTLSPKTRSIHYNFINKKFIPWLKASGIKEYARITPQFIAKFQDYLLKGGNKPQTVNYYMSGIKTVFDHLVMMGVIQHNVFDRVRAIKLTRDFYKVRGCHEIPALKGVFNREWPDKVSYLLCLIIYTTGIRNSEIERICFADIKTIGPYRYIDIRQSKTNNGIRIVPLHDFVYTKIAQHVKQTGKRKENYLFSLHGGPNQSTLYRRANRELGKHLGMEEAELTEKGISFYSGRHFWKTLMNGSGLGDDIEEIFMGHKVSGDVSRRYNHRDKQGKELLVSKISRMFSILDKKLFAKGK